MARPPDADLTLIRYTLIGIGPRYFVGMTNDEAAEALGISPHTAKYYWTHARAWLYREIEAHKE